MADARRQDMAIRAFEKKSIQAEGRGLGPAEQLLFDLQILRDEERDERRADEERQTQMEQRAMAQYSAEVADVRRDGDSPTVALSRPWSSWLTLPRDEQATTDWMYLRWMWRRDIKIPKDCRVYNATKEEYGNDDPPPNTKYMRRLTDEEKATMRKLMADWATPRREQAMRVADACARVHGRHHAALLEQKERGEEVHIWSADWVPPRLPFSFQACVDKVMRTFGRESAAATKLPDDQCVALAEFGKNRVVLMARQRLAMASALLGWAELSTRRYLKRWGYKIFPRSRSSWKCRAKEISAAIIELLPRIAWAHLSINPSEERVLSEELVRRAQVEEEQMALKDAVAHGHVTVARAILTENLYGKVTADRKVPRSTYSYLHLAVMAGRHLFGEHSLTNWELPRVGQWNWELPTYPFKDVANLEIIRVVLEAGVSDINVPDGSMDKLTPLHYAAYMWDEEIFDFLVDQGADPSVRTTEGSTMFHLATRYAKLSAVWNEAPPQVNAWCNRVTQLTERREPDRWPADDDVPAGLSLPRFLACLKRRCKERGGLTIDQGIADRRGQTHPGYPDRTPLYLACTEHKLHVVKVLIKAGADPSLGSAPPELERFDRDNPSLESPCAAALKYNWDTDTDGAKLVSYLLDSGVTDAGPGLTRDTASGWPYFIVAFTQGLEGIGIEEDEMIACHTPVKIMPNEALLDCLLERNADINVLTDYNEKIPGSSLQGDNALLLACGGPTRFSNPDISLQYDPEIAVVEWLLDRNAKISVANRFGQTALWFACRAAAFKCNCGLNLSGDRAECVCGKGREAARMVQYLVNHGAPVNQADIHGVTPFHVACIHGQLAIVRLLLFTTDADPWQADYFGCFPRDAAMMRGYHTICQLIDQKHIPTRVVYEGSLGRGDPAVMRAAGTYVTSGIDAITNEDYPKALISFKVALAKINGKDVLPSSAPDLCWMLAYTCFRAENLKLVAMPPINKPMDVEHRWLHCRTKSAKARAPVIDAFSLAFKCQRTHFLTWQTIDWLRLKDRSGAEDDPFLRMIMCSASVEQLKEHLSTQTPGTFKTLYGRTLCTPLFLSIQYSTPEFFKVLLDTTGDWELGGPRPGKPTGPGGPVVDPVDPCPHYKYAWGGARGEKQRSITLHELHSWSPLMTPLEVGKLRLEYGWCPVTVSLTSVSQRKQCVDMLTEYIAVREGKPTKKKTPKKTPKKKKKKKKADTDAQAERAGDDADASAQEPESTDVTPTDESSSTGEKTAGGVDVASMPESVRAALARAGVSALIPNIEEASPASKVEPAPEPELQPEPEPEPEPGPEPEPQIQPDLQELHDELNGMKASKLRVRAAADGIDAALIAAARDEEHVKSAMVRLIMKHHTRALQKLHDELNGMKASALRVRAAADGIDAALIAAARDEEHVKSAMVRLIMKHHTRLANQRKPEPAPDTEPQPAPQPRPEPEPQPKSGPVKKDASATFAEVETLLRKNSLHHYASKMLDMGFDDVAIIREYIDAVVAEVGITPPDEQKLRTAVGLSSSKKGSGGDAPEPAAKKPPSPSSEEPPAKAATAISAAPAPSNKKPNKKGNKKGNKKAEQQVDKKVQHKVLPGAKRDTKQVLGRDRRTGEAVNAADILAELDRIQAQADKAEEQNGELRSKCDELSSHVETLVHVQIDLRKQLEAAQTTGDRDSWTAEKVDMQDQIAQLSANLAADRRKLRVAEAATEKLAVAEAEAEGLRAALMAKTSDTDRRPQLEKLLARELVEARQKLAAMAGSEAKQNGEEPAAAEKATKQTAAQRRQAKARLEAAAQASRDVENLLRKCASEWVPLPVSKLPTLYAEEYGRHRPLSLPSWEQSLKELPTCHLIEATESDTDGPWVLWIGDGSQQWS